MEHRRPGPVRKRAFENRRIGKIAYDKLCAGKHGSGMACRKIVQHHALRAPFQLLRRQVAADIAGTAGNQILAFHLGDPPGRGAREFDPGGGSMRRVGVATSYPISRQSTVISPPFLASTNSKLPPL